MNLNWEDANEAGHVVVECPSRKLAIYANLSGQVVLAHCDDGVDAVTLIEADEFDEVLGFLLKAMTEARSIACNQDAEFETHEAIGRAKGDRS